VSAGGKAFRAAYALDLADPHFPRLREVLVCVLTYRRESDSLAAPSVRLMAWELEISRATVQRYLRRLEALGVLVPKGYRTGGRGHYTEYAVNLTALAKRPAYDSRDS
jgi:hypothetical protein